MIKNTIKSFLHFFHLDIHKYSGLTPMLEFVRDKNKKDLVGAEIGVYRGLNAEQILKQLPIKMLYLVDPYKDYNDGYDSENMKAWFGNPKENEREMQERLSIYDNCTFIKKKSNEAESLVPNQLDFVYIDGNHTYEFVLEDIEIYYRKLKAGGVIGGHDFNNRGLFEVTNAVLDFVQKHQLQLYSFGQDWWIVKGEKRQLNNWFEK